MMENSKIERYLIQAMINYQDAGEGQWLIDDESRGLPGVLVSHNDPLVIVTIEIMSVPKAGEAVLADFYAKLLALNTDLLHGAYALMNDKVILIDTLEYDTMDYSEFLATLDAISLALVQHFPILSKYRGRT